MKALLPVGAILFLTACGGSSSTPGITSAAFVESISANPADYRIGGVTSETPDGDVVSVSTGLGPDGANATVLIDIASDLGGTLHGTARYDSFYVVEGFADVVPDDTVPGEPFAGTLVREEGTFVANVDLDTARISGGDTRFVLDGTLSGQIMSGSVTFEGLEGDLIGKVGPSLLFGGFIIETPDAALGDIVRGSPLP